MRMFRRSAVLRSVELDRMALSLLFLRAEHISAF
jgi:hypothetical protein